MNRIGQIIAIVGTGCFIWFIWFFIKYGWDTNFVNMTMGIIGSILVVGGTNLMQSSKKGR
jgi:hypothetical protein